jgi:hypothetical protein
MKKRLLLPVLLCITALMFLRSAAPGQDTEPKSEFWWEMELTMSVTGNYRCSFNNVDSHGEYSFDIRATGGLEQDISKDYILYSSDPEITALQWKDAALKKEMKPSLHLNYVLNESGYIYFDLEVVPQPLPAEDSGPFAFLLLPRSALNKDINKKDKYNKDIINGSNNIRIPEKSILGNDETVKEFKWKWQRNKNGLMNAHSVEMKIRIIRKKREIRT